MDLSASEAIFGFVAWLTTQKTAIIAGSAHDCAPWVEKIQEFCKTNKLSEPRERWEQNIVYPSDIEGLAKAQGVRPIDIRTLSGTWPDDINDGFDEAIERLRHKSKDLTRLTKGLRDLRYGIFQDQQAVNDLLDELIVLAEAET